MMKALKIVASIPLALIIGGVGDRILENGLWPLLLFSDEALVVIHFAIEGICELVAFGGLVWFWALGRS